MQGLRWCAARVIEIFDDSGIINTFDQWNS